ncbi:hypothetical protein HRbin11_00676 [bacterium HR11]|nr:hypothetical protein HRbin11_00676 [bacterium HR11]
MMPEILFIVQESPQGGYEAWAPGFSIYTEADTDEELRQMIVDAVRCHFDPADLPRLVRVHFIREEVLAL